MAGMPSGTVIASDSELVRYAVQHALHSALFRVLVVMMYTVWSWVVHLKIFMRLQWELALLTRLVKTPKV